jgi:ATP-dependent RNA helicase HrpB
MLPLEPLLPDLRAAMASHRTVVLHAPPGAGKTTLTPLALLDEPWLGGKTIVMLEPRRLAARAAAERLAELHGDRVGETIGYRMRMDHRVGRRTRIEVVTEGVLTRRLQDDPILDGVGLVIFDEFHERSLNADLGLALTLRAQELVRDDLRILVMSATLDRDALARVIDRAPILASEGRAFPIETRHVTPRPGVRLEGAVTAAVLDALRREEGDLLVFLPGAAEIRRVHAALSEHSLGDDVRVLPLHGTLTPDAQRRAILPAPAPSRKIVLSTSIAETSLTIEGVRVVIDAGLSRVPRFSPRSGMSRLETVRVSRASADQRRGRAGRLGPGVCYRLWPEHEESHLLPHAPAEILVADLTPLALDLASSGVSDPAELRWIDPPPAAALGQALELLVELGALDDRGRVTDHGKRMAGLPVHPRLAHMLLRAQELGQGYLACEVAALLAERDILRSETDRDADLALRIEALRGDHSTRAGTSVDREGVHRARGEAARLARQLGEHVPERLEPPDSAGVLLALAYPDRIGQRRAGNAGRFLLRNGRGAVLPGAQPLGASPFIVAAELDDQRPDSRIFVAASLTLDELRAHMPDQIESEQVVELSRESGAVVARDRERLGAIVLRETHSARVDADQVKRVLLAEIRRLGIAALPWSDAARRLRERITFLRCRAGDDWPDLSDAALSDRLNEWLAPLLDGVVRVGDVQRVDLVGALSAMLRWDQRRTFDELAPSHLVVPSGSRQQIDYSNPAAPTLAVRIQELFGLEDTPRLLGGTVRLTLQLLSPAHRPVQVTDDLAGFWRTSYFDVRKDLRGRYPKHDWPEDPLHATATHRAKRRH